MKKMRFVGMLALCAVAVLEAQTPQNGFYFAQASQYAVDGWRDQVVLEVKGGKISAATWNKISLMAGVPDRKSWVSAGKDESGWAAQAAKVEQFLVSSQNLNAASVSGVTIPVEPFFALARQALANPPAAKGMYKKSGWFYGEVAAADGSGTRVTVLVTVVNGTIVDALWNEVVKTETGEASKIMMSATGKYPMNAPQGAWHAQANRAAGALVKVQDPAKITTKPDHTPDAITGVSISVENYLKAATQALKAAK
jgi:major membrane immunogen (membrane-anchored lipoprotein)